jgi:hypothetical protein
VKTEVSNKPCEELKEGNACGANEAVSSKRGDDGNANESPEIDLRLNGFVRTKTIDIVPIALRSGL